MPCAKWCDFIVTYTPLISSSIPSVASGVMSPIIPVTFPVWAATDSWMEIVLFDDGVFDVDRLVVEVRRLLLFSLVRLIDHVC